MAWLNPAIAASALLVGMTALPGCGAGEATPSATTNQENIAPEENNMPDVQPHDGPIVILDETGGPERFESASGSTLSLKYVGKAGECALVFTTLDGETSEHQICAGEATSIGGWQVGLTGLFSASANVSVLDPDGQPHGG